jgi:hypothetical protein
MTTISLFNAMIGDAPPRLTVAITQTFNPPDDFVVTLGDDRWPLSARDAETLAAAGKRIEGALDFAAQRHEPVEAAAFYNRQLGGGGGNAATVEIGIDCAGEFAAPYLSWRDRRIIDSSGRLLKALSILSDACSLVRRTTMRARVLDIQIDLKNCRSPFGWDGRAPWEL